MAVVLQLVTPVSDHGQGLNWNAASSDYLKYRSGYPDSYFRLLRELGIGLSGQRILDLGVGTGALAIPFALQGAQVTGIDPSPGQIEACRSHAQALGASLELKLGRAEATGLPDASADVVAASMSWGYFDKQSVVSEVLRVLAPGGRLLISSLSWLAPPGSLAQRTKDLITKYQPGMRRRTDERLNDTEILPAELHQDFRLQTYHYYIPTLTLSKESWRGQVRACKWIAPALSPEKVLAFDAEHAQLLAQEVEPLQIEHLVQFSILTKI